MADAGAIPATSARNEKTKGFMAQPRKMICVRAAVSTVVAACSAVPDSIRRIAAIASN
jgi:hypothetical protein